VFTISCGVNPLVGVTSGGTKLAAFADLFQYYRFRRFSARIISATTQANPAAYATVRTVMGAEAYGSSLPGTESEVLQMSEASEAAIVVAGVTSSIYAQMPSVTRWFHLSKRLLGDQQVKWYRTQPGSFDDALEYSSTSAFRHCQTLRLIQCALTYNFESKSNFGASHLRT
jgi:hypothetical protein